MGGRSTAWWHRYLLFLWPGLKTLPRPMWITALSLAFVLFVISKVVESRVLPVIMGPPPSAGQPTLSATAIPASPDVNTPVTIIQISMTCGATDGHSRDRID
jgi:hypothetical protein